ncbi:TonB-dependent receptor plug domain-containing protein [Sphingomonas morindae]|uniref:TonB-dependent receptor n=1 Tax=Sphingomonas morindae TaxID=1541170 RepID=A0ABY4XBW6_9SPHN|nr:TonB-dependent receptor [Sphingomonas morindae]USI74314.1 TonB-dependent receptor [Sphingomonas morindae]
MKFIGLSSGVAMVAAAFGGMAAPALGQSAQSGAALGEAAAAGGDILVTAGRALQPRAQTGQAVTVLDTEEITTRQSVLVADLLRQTPGVEVTRNGGVGTTSAVTIRGAESDQTVALIDGIKLNDPSAPGGGFDFGGLLVGNIARIEIVRGAQSVLWGNQAIGGVINLITRQPGETLSINARAEGGSYGTGQIFANVSGRQGPVAASLGAGFYRTDGISAFAGGREPDGYRNHSANGNVTVTLSPTLSIDLRGFYADGRTDIDGFPPPDYVFADTRERSWQRQWIGYGGVNLALFDGRLRNRLGFARTDTRRHNRDPDSVPDETFRAHGRTSRIDYQGVLDIRTGVQATFGAEREVSRFTSASGGPAIAGRTRLFSGYGQLALTPLSGLTLTGGVRHDDHNRFGGATTGSASAAWSPNGGATVLRGSYSEGFKAPTPYQLGSEYGNVALRPERSRGWDGGIEQRALGGAAVASATWFHRLSRDLITFVSCDTPLTGICADRPFGTYDNVARARAQGVELALALTPVEAFTLRWSYTYLDARDRTPGAGFGRRLARRPSNTGALNADYRWRFGLALGATLTMAGASFDDAANSRRLKGYSLVDLRAAYPLGRHVELYGRIENLFDARYQTVFQYGQAGRAAYGGVRLRY